MRDFSLIQAAGLNTGINPVWTLQRAYADGETDLPPVGGRILRITFATAPTIGDSIVMTLDGSDLAAVTWASISSLSARLRAQASVLYAVDVSTSVCEVAFAPGEPGVLTFKGGQPADATITDATEGVDVSSGTRAGLAVLARGVQAELEVGDLIFTARETYPGTDGNALKVEIVTGSSLAVAFADPKLTITMASGGSTGDAILAALWADRDIMSRYSAAVKAGGNGASTQTNAAAAFLAGGTDPEVDGNLWGFVRGGSSGALNEWVQLSGFSTAFSATVRKKMGTPSSLPVDGIERLFFQVTKMIGSAEVWIAPAGGVST